MVDTKNSKVFALPVVVIIVLFILTGCSSDSADTLSTARYDVNFTVVDKASTEAVPGAELVLAGERKITDDKGLAAFKRVNGSYDYQVKATGYREQDGEIVVKGENTFKDLELEIIAPSNDGEDGDDEGETPEVDNTPPVFQKLFAVIEGNVYGAVDPVDIEEITESDQCVILNFSEAVEFESFDKSADFEIQLLDLEQKIIKPIKIESFAEVATYADYLVIEIEDLAETEVYIEVTINESGRQKITDLAGNLLSESSKSLELLIN